MSQPAFKTTLSTAEAPQKKETQVAATPEGLEKPAEQEDGPQGKGPVETVQVIRVARSFSVNSAGWFEDTMNLGHAMGEADGVNTDFNNQEAASFGAREVTPTLQEIHELQDKFEKDHESVF